MAINTDKILTYVDVLYYTNITIYGAMPARLVVTKDNHLVLTSAEGSAEQPIYKEIFNTPASGVTKIGLVADQLSVKFANKTYRMSISQYMTPLIATGGVVGGAVAYGMQKKWRVSAY